MANVFFVFFVASKYKGFIELVVRGHRVPKGPKFDDAATAPDIPIPTASRSMTILIPV